MAQLTSRCRPGAGGAPGFRVLLAAVAIAIAGTAAARAQAPLPPQKPQPPAASAAPNSSSSVSPPAASLPGVRPPSRVAARPRLSTDAAPLPRPRPPELLELDAEAERQEAAAAAPAPQEPPAFAFPPLFGPPPAPAGLADPPAAPQAPVIASLPPAAAPLPPPRPAGEAPPAAAQPARLPAACVALVEAGAIAAEIEPGFTSKPGCDLADPVRLTAIRLKDGRMAALKPAAILRCETVLAVAAWVREDVAPAVAALGTRVEAVKVAASYDCRPRNRVLGARMSEHGYGNALDVGGFEVADRRRLEVEGGGFPLSLQNLMKDSACRRFSTVLGPGSDGYHEDHIHVDIASRRNDYKLCRWVIQDKPLVAAPVPKPKPADAAPASGAADEEAEVPSAGEGTQPGEATAEGAQGPNAAGRASAPGAKPQPGPARRNAAGAGGKGADGKGAPPKGAAAKDAPKGPSQGTGDKGASDKGAADKGAGGKAGRKDGPAGGAVPAADPKGAQSGTRSGAAGGG